MVIFVLVMLLSAASGFAAGSLARRIDRRHGNTTCADALSSGGLSLLISPKNKSENESASS
jgi:hypothetical protein